jgi:polyhydroxyalkanoate synthase
MSDQPRQSLTQDLLETSQELTRISGLSAALLLRLARRWELPNLDPLNLRRPTLAALGSTLRHPQRILAAQWDLTRRYLGLMKYLGLKTIGRDTAPAITPEHGDRRFRSDAWNEQLIFDLLRQAYLLTADWMLDNVARMQDVAPADRMRIHFYTRQFAHALSPSNFLLTNPEILKATREERGLNLLRGFRQLLEDLQYGDGQLLI